MSVEVYQERLSGVNVGEIATEFYFEGMVSTLAKTREADNHTTQLGKEWFGSAPSLSSPLTFDEPTIETEGLLLRKQEKGVEKTELLIPKLEWPLRADPTLTVAIRKLFSTLWTIVISRALQVRFPIKRTVISTFNDEIEQEHKAVLRLFCKANAAQALAFWDSLEPDLQSWLNLLTEKDRRVFITKLSLRIHWQ